MRKESSTGIDNLISHKKQASIKRFLKINLNDTGIVNECTG